MFINHFAIKLLKLMIIIGLALALVIGLGFILVAGFFLLKCYDYLYLNIYLITIFIGSIILLCILNSIKSGIKNIYIEKIINLLQKIAIFTCIVTGFLSGIT